MDAPALIGRRTLLLGSAGAALPAVAVAGAPAATAAGIDTRAALTSALQAYLRGRTGTYALAFHDRHNQSTYSYNLFRTETLSTVKVLILAALLRHYRQRGRALTSTQRTLAARMIQLSDNSAANTLLAAVGATRVQQLATAVGMRWTTIQGGTAAGSSRWWGYSTSNPLDMVALMKALVWGSPYLDPADRTYVYNLMYGVTAAQRWGVCDPPLPSSTYTLVKNGWGPRSGGYRVNSVGYVYGSGRWYAMSIFGRSPAGFTYGRNTVNALSRLVFNALDAPLV